MYVHIPQFLCSRFCNLTLPGVSVPRERKLFIIAGHVYTELQALLSISFYYVEPICSLFHSFFGDFKRNFISNVPLNSQDGHLRATCEHLAEKAGSSFFFATLSCCIGSIATFQYYSKWSFLFYKNVKQNFAILFLMLCRIVDHRTPPQWPSPFTHYARQVSSDSPNPLVDWIKDHTGVVLKCTSVRSSFKKESAIFDFLFEFAIYPDCYCYTFIMIPLSHTLLEIEAIQRKTTKIAFSSFVRKQKLRISNFNGRKKILRLPNSKEFSITGLKARRMYGIYFSSLRTWLVGGEALQYLQYF